MSIKITCPTCKDSTLQEGEEDKLECSKCKAIHTQDALKESFEAGTLVLSEAEDDKETSKFVKSMTKDKESDDIDDEDNGGSGEPKGKLKEGKEIVKDALAKLFEDGELSEDHKAKIATVFKGAVTETVAVEKQKMQEAAEAQVKVIKEEHEAKLTEEKEKLAEELESYLDYVADGYLKENKVALESKLRLEAAEDFLSKMTEAFQSNFLEVPEGKDLVAESESRLEAEKEAHNKTLKECIELKKASKDRDIRESLEEVSKGLTAIDAERLSTLSESIDFTDKEQYTKELNILRSAFSIEESDADKAERTGITEQTLDKAPTDDLLSEGVEPKAEEPKTETYTFRL